MAQEEALFDGMDFGSMFQDDVPETTEDVKDEEEVVDDEVTENEDDLVIDTDDDLSDNEETEEDTSEEDEEKAPSDKSNNSSSSSNYKVFAKALYDEGVLSSFKEDKEFKSAEDLISSIKEEIEGQVEGYKNGLPELLKTMIDKYEDGMDLSQFIQSKKEEMDYSKINESQFEDNESLTKSIIVRDFIDMGYTEEEAAEEAAEVFELGKEQDRAKRALKRIQKRIKENQETMTAKAKADLEERKANYAKQLQSIDKSLKDTSEIAGIEITEKMRKDAFKAMTEVVGEINGVPANAITKARAEDPVEFDKKLGLLFVATNGFKDWSKVSKVSKKKAIDDLEKALNSNTSTKPKRKVVSDRMGYPQETIFSSLNFK